jgi:hypothetical protein
VGAQGRLIPHGREAAVKKKNGKQKRGAASFCLPFLPREYVKKCNPLISYEKNRILTRQWTANNKQ